MKLKYIFNVIISAISYEITTGQTENYIEIITRRQIDGFDCSNPIYINSYQYTTENNCEHIKKLKPKKTYEKHYQILQKHNKVRTEGFYCEVYKTTRSQYCGTFSHAIGITSLDVTNLKIRIPISVCKKWIRAKELGPEF